MPFPYAAAPAIATLHRPLIVQNEGYSMISLNDYANLRSYAGSETAVMLENRYHHGVFTRDDADTTSQTTALP